MWSDQSSERSDSPGSLKDFIVDDDVVEYISTYETSQDHEGDACQETVPLKRQRSAPDSDEEEEFTCSTEEDAVSEEEYGAWRPHAVGSADEDEDYVDTDSAPTVFTRQTVRRSTRVRKAPTRYIDVEHYRKYMLGDDADDLFSQNDDENDEDFSIRTGNEDDDEQEEEEEEDEEDGGEEQYGGSTTSIGTDSVCTNNSENRSQAGNTGRSEE